MSQITALTNAKDHERLTLLKEVAGTKVYEQRRSESLRLMEETGGYRLFLVKHLKQCVVDAKRTKINELLQYIEDRLAELEEEKEELKEFQDKDKERRCLEYALYYREVEEVGEALDEVGGFVFLQFCLTFCWISWRKSVSRTCTLRTSDNARSPSARNRWRSVFSSAPLPFRSF